MQQLPLATAPQGLWPSIEAKANESPKPLAFPVWRYALATLALAVTSTVLWNYPPVPAGQWEVLSLNGGDIAAKQLVHTGQWIETGSSSRARIRIGAIGSVDVEPNTRVRLVSTGAAGHRLALANGAIKADISAPPRLFFVDTPAGTAVDLGCEYELNCDRAGAGMLRVSAGWVAFEWMGKESLVPAGASCRFRPGKGPGTPYFDDAPAALVDALEGFDFSLDVVLQAARSRDTLTLWHLLSRVEETDRARVYDRMAALAPPPQGVTREAVLRLDANTLKRWREELAWIW